MAYQEQGNSEESSHLLERSLEIQTNRADAYDHLGRIAQEQGKHDMAVDYFKKAQKLNPQMAGLHYRIGQAYKDLGETDQAISEAKRMSNCIRWRMIVMFFWVNCISRNRITTTPKAIMKGSRTQS